MDALFIDFETTGDNPQRHQAYEFAAVPVYNGIIRADLMWHTYIEHHTYKIQKEIFKEVTERLNNPRPGISSVTVRDWERLFKNKLKSWFDLPVTIGGKNVGSFDIQFICAMDESFRNNREYARYSYIDIGSMYLEGTDDRVPKLSLCRERAISEGAPISVENSHYAEDDALLCAELFVWETEGRILYGKPAYENSVQLRLYQQPIRKYELERA